MPKKKKKHSKGYISKGERPNVAKATTARIKALRTPSERLAFKLKAAVKGLKVNIAKTNNWKLERWTPTTDRGK